MTPQQIAGFARGAHIRPVFTAHPTESARRSILSKLRAMDSQLNRPIGPNGRDASWRRRMLELIEGVIQTDELRQSRPGPLDEAPQMRLAVIRLTDDDTRFVWTFHHILLDGWSGARVVREVLAHYSELKDEPPLGHREETLVPLKLSKREMEDLEAFLRTLTGAPLDPALLEPPPER